MICKTSSTQTKNPLKHPRLWLTIMTPLQLLILQTFISVLDWEWRLYWTRTLMEVMKVIRAIKPAPISTNSPSTTAASHLLQSLLKGNLRTPSFQSAAQSTRVLQDKENCVPSAFIWSDSSLKSISPLLIPKISLTIIIPFLSTLILKSRKTRFSARRYARSTPPATCDSAENGS